MMYARKPLELDNIELSYNAILDALVITGASRADAVAACLGVIMMQTIDKAVEHDEYLKFVSEAGAWIALYFADTGKTTH